MASARAQVGPAQPQGFVEASNALCTAEELSVERGLLQLWKAWFVGKVLFTLDKGFF